MEAKTPLQVMFNDECLRLAENESKPLAEVNRELGKLVNVSATWISKYRYGQAAIPAEHIPVFCRRFGNRRLIEAFLAMCDPADDPGEADRLRLATEQAKQSMAFTQSVLESFDDGRIEWREIRELEERAAHLKARVGELVAIARADYERQRAA